jgi:hypothetical protein
MYLKKTFELDKDDIQIILNKLSITELSDELLSRDAKLIAFNLNETQKLQLLRELFNQNSVSEDMFKELEYQLRRYHQELPAECVHDVLIRIKQSYDQTHFIAEVLQTLVEIIRGAK